MVIKRKALILPYAMTFNVQLHLESQLKSLDPSATPYFKAGPKELGDNKVIVNDGETSIEIFSDIHHQRLIELVPEAREVEVIWDDN